MAGDISSSICGQVPWFEPLEQDVWRPFQLHLQTAPHGQINTANPKSSIANSIALAVGGDVRRRRATTCKL